MPRRADRDVPERQRIAGLDRSFRAALDLLSDREALGRDHVAALAVGVAHERDAGAAVRVVFEALDLARDAVLVTAEIDDAVVMLVAATLVAGGDVAHGVAPRALREGFHERRA